MQTFSLGPMYSEYISTNTKVDKAQRLFNQLKNVV